MIFSSHLTEGYYIDFASGSEGYDHKYCGENLDKTAICPNCQMPLIHLLQLDKSDERLRFIANDNKYIRIYYCFNCAIHEDILFYKIKNDETIEILSYKENYNGYKTNWIAGGLFDKWKQPEYYPEAKIRLEQTTSDQRLYLLSMFLYNRIDLTLIDRSLLVFNNYAYDNSENYVPLLCNLIGGIPALNFLWETSNFTCPICYESMSFLLVLDHEYTDICGDNVSFVGEGIEIVSAYCAKCNVIAVMLNNWE